MSYSFIRRCDTCTKVESCVDADIIGGAVSSIHSIGSDKGHLGGGSITLDCNYHTSAHAVTTESDPAVSDPATGGTEDPSAGEPASP